MPYEFNREEIATAASTEQTRDRSGWGDLELAWTTQFTRERGAIPNVLGSVTWKTATGRFTLGDAASPGSGFNSLQVGVTAVKRQDPLVFFGAVTHAFNMSRHVSGSEVTPGDSNGLKFGTILAASPETSLRFGFELSRSGKTELNGATLPGSDNSTATLELGAGTILGARSLLDLRFAIGLTPATPNYRIDLALPIRFY
jgi:hypothetical protein